MPSPHPAKQDNPNGVKIICALGNFRKNREVARDIANHRWVLLGDIDPKVMLRTLKKGKFVINSLPRPLKKCLKRFWRQGQGPLMYVVNLNGKKGAFAQDRTKNLIEMIHFCECVLNLCKCILKLCCFYPFWAKKQRKCQQRLRQEVHRFWSLWWILPKGRNNAKASLSSKCL